MQSASSLPESGTRQKLSEALARILGRLRQKPTLEGFDRMFRELDRYRIAYEQHTGRSFADARILEIGYGARPFCLLALSSMGLNVRGIDLDQPMLRFSARTLFQIYKRNGFERALKTCVRGVLCDPADWANLRESLRLRGYRLTIDSTRLLVGDASTYDFGPDPIDLVYASHVFEHIPQIALEKLMKQLASRIAPNGLALITPNIFTGITGGHLIEWYSDVVDQDVKRTSEPWEHLRKRRFTADTYLNRLTLADYREIFGRDFEIVEGRVLRPELGRRWLTPEVREELADWNDEELFSNAILFVLRPKAALA